MVVVDDTGKLGGGQLSLVNYLRQASELDRAALFVEDGPAAALAHETGTAVHVLGPQTSRFRKFARAIALSRVLRDEDPDVVLVNSLRAALIMSLIPRVGACKILYVHELLSREWLRSGRFGSVKYAVFERWVLPRFDGLLANSDTTAATIPATVRVPVRRAFPVAGVGNLGHPHTSSPERPLRVLYLGRVAYWKGIGTLLEALQIIEQEMHGRPGVQVILAGDATFGDADLLATIEDYSHAHPDVLAYVGFREDVDDLLDKVDVLFSGSLIPEPFGLGVVQALARGVPVITTKNGGPEEILGTSGAGVAYDAGDARGLANILITLAGDRPQVHAMSLRALRAAEPFLDADASRSIELAIHELDRAVR